MENSTPCKIVTLENFILKLGIRDYVENITYYTNFHVHRFSGGFSQRRRQSTASRGAIVKFRGAHGERGARAYKGVWGHSPQRGPGAKPLVRGTGGRSPPEAESFSAL